MEEKSNQAKLARIEFDYREAIRRIKLDHEGRTRGLPDTVATRNLNSSHRELIKAVDIYFRNLRELARK